MSEQTKIEWADSTFNPWTGCTKISPACDHCYAESWSNRAGQTVGKWGPGAPRVRTSAANWKHPERWNREPFWQCENCRWRGDDREVKKGGHCPGCAYGVLAPARRRVFCASLADVFDNEVDPAWRAELFALIANTPNLDWLLLTKRIGNVASMIAAPGMQKCGLPPNVWLGATICNQAEADRDIPKLLATPASVRFLSIEPMLGQVDLYAAIPCDHETGIQCPDTGAWECSRCERQTAVEHLEGLDWVICGGESGPHARPMHPDWARSLRDQCADASVPFLFKQWGEWSQYVNEDHYTHCGKENRPHAWVDSLTGESGLCWIIDDYGLWSNYTGKPPMDERSHLLPRCAVMGWHGKKAAGRTLDGRTHDGFPGGES